MALTVRREQGAAAVLNIPEELGVKVWQLLLLGLRFRFAILGLRLGIWSLGFGVWGLHLRAWGWGGVGGFGCGFWIWFGDAPHAAPRTGGIGP